MTGEIMRISGNHINVIGFAAAGLVAAATLAASPAKAGLTDFSLFWSSEYQQTGPTTVIPFNSGTNYFFTGLADVGSNSDYDVNGLTLTVPTSPTTNYVMNGPSGTSPFINYAYQSGFLTQSELNSEFPSGDYVLNAVNTGTGATATVTLSYDGTQNFASPPTLTAASYDGLTGGLDPSDPFTLAFNEFVPTGGDEAATFVTITDLATDTVVFSDTFISSGVTSVVIPAGTLLPGTEYVEELDFSTRTVATSGIDCTSSPDGQCPGLTELAFDSRTLTDFTTGVVPEPSTWAMMLVGFAGLGFASYRSALNRGVAAIAA